MPHLCPVPLSAPIRPMLPGVALPSSGPYYVSSAADGRVVLLPNPGYGGHRPRHWARIVYTLDVPTAEAVALVDRGKLDYLPLDFDRRSLLDRWGVLDRRYGPDRDAAEYGAQEVIVVTITYDHAARRRSYELIAEAFAESRAAA